MKKVLTSIIGASLLLFGCGAGCNELVRQIGPAAAEFERGMAEYRRTKNISCQTNSYSVSQSANISTNLISINPVPFRLVTFEPIIGPRYSVYGIKTNK